MPFFSNQDSIFFFFIKKNTSLLKARRKNQLSIPKSYQLDVTIFHMLMNIDICAHIYVYKIKLHNNLFA